MATEKWEKVNSTEFFNDVERANKEPYKMQGHSFQMRKNLPKQVCSSCGLMLLRNDLTAWCVKYGCLYRRHPEYKSRIR